MQLILFFIPAMIFGYIAGANSLWWIVLYALWVLSSFQCKYMEWVNGGRLGSPGAVLFFADIFIFIACLLVALLVLPHFSFLALLH